MSARKCIRTVVQNLANHRYMSTTPAGVQSYCRKIRPINKMCGWQIHSYGSLDEVEHSDNLKIPILTSPNQLLVKVTAASVNPIDVAMISKLCIFFNSFRLIYIHQHSLRKHEFYDRNTHKILPWGITVLPDVTARKVTIVSARCFNFTYDFP